MTILQGSNLNDDVEALKEENRWLCEGLEECKQGLERYGWELRQMNTNHNQVWLILIDPNMLRLYPGSSLLFVSKRLLATARRLLERQRVLSMPKENVMRVADSAPFVAVLILQGQRLVAIAFLRR